MCVWICVLIDAVEVLGGDAATHIYLFNISCSQKEADTEATATSDNVDVGNKEGSADVAAGDVENADGDGETGEAAQEEADDGLVVRKGKKKGKGKGK